MIRGITFPEQEFRSEDFAHFVNLFLNGSKGLTKGCEITASVDSITIGKGFFLFCGRMLNVENAEVISGDNFHNGYNRIVYEVDLSKENTVSEFRQGKIRVLPTADLIQQDLDNGGMVYQFPFCHFNWNAAEMTDFVVDAKKLVMADMWAGVIATIEAMLGKVESITKKDAVVNVEDFAEDTTYVSYPYRAEIMIQGVTSDYIPNVYFDVEESDSGMFSSVCSAMTDKVIIYAKEVPSKTFIIPIIKCDRGAGV